MSQSFSQRSDVGPDESISQVNFNEEDVYSDQEKISITKDVAASARPHSTSLTNLSYFNVNKDNLEEAKSFLKVPS